MLTELDIKCLSSIADDYEEVPQIKKELKIIDAIDVSADDISISLHKLVSSKLAQAYEFDVSKNDFVEIDFTYEKALLPSAEHTWRPGEGTASRMWFYITRAGQDFLNTAS